MQRRIAFDIEEIDCRQKYLTNLRRNIGKQVKTQKPTNIEEAQNMATKMRNWLKKSQQRVWTPRVPNKSMSLSNRLEINCHKCEKLGHFANQYYAKPNFHQGHFPKRPTNPVQNIQEEETNYLDAQRMTQEEIEEQVV